MKKSKKKRSADSSDANAVTVAITSFVGEPKGREMVASLGSSHNLSPSGSKGNARSQKD